MEFQIIKTEDKARGRLYHVNVAGKEIDLIMTWHAIERTKIWNLDREIF